MGFNPDVAITDFEKSGISDATLKKVYNMYEFCILELVFLVLEFLVLHEQRVL